MLKSEFKGLKTILCLGAHADDIEIGCGGTLLKLLAENESLHVHWVVLGAGGRRADEATASAGAFLDRAGSSRVVVKGFRDSFFPYVGGEVKEYFCELQKEVAPDLIFTHRREDMHQDHRLVAELTWQAFRDHLILEYEIPKYEGDLGNPNVYVPLSESVSRRKVDTILDAFPSQRDKPWFSEETFWSLLRIRGVESNAPSRYAEGLYCRKMTI